MDYHSNLLNILLTTVSSPAQQDALLFFGMIVLLFLSFAIAGSEVAFFSLSYKDIQILKTKHNKALKRVVVLLEHPNKLLTSMLIANSFINICIILIANTLINHLFVFDQITIISSNLKLNEYKYRIICQKDISMTLNIELSFIISYLKTSI